MTDTNTPPSNPTSETPAQSAPLVALLAWVFPGAGHFYLGQRGLALVFAGLIFFSLAVGCVLEGNLHQIVSGRPLTILATLGNMGLGLPYFLLRFVFRYEGEVTSSGFEYGTAFILTAGLMNLLLVLDVWDKLRAQAD